MTTIETISKITKVEEYDGYENEDGSETITSAVVTVNACNDGDPEYVFETIHEAASEIVKSINDAGISVNHFETGDVDFSGSFAEMTVTIFFN